MFDFVAIDICVFKMFLVSFVLKFKSMRLCDFAVSAYLCVLPASFHRFNGALWRPDAPSIRNRLMLDGIRNRLIALYSAQAVSGTDTYAILCSGWRYMGLTKILT